VGPNKAYVRTVQNVSVSDGSLNIKSVYGSADDPEVVGIEVVPRGTSSSGGGTADTQAPSTPTGLTVTGFTTSSISLSWNASTDNVAVAGYGLYQNGALVASTQQTSYTFTGLACGTTYTLAVDAFDAAGNRSGKASITTSTSACTGPSPISSTTPCGVLSSPPATYDHVIWIVMENHAYEQVVGSRKAAYENSLASKCGLATNYYALTHPSLPNYIAMTSGDTWGITDDADPSADAVSVASIYSQVNALGKQWRDYEEDAPGNCPMSDSYPYVVHHDPAPYYTAIRTDCNNWDVPMGTTSGGNFLSALNANTLPAFAFVTPNMCNDMHDCTIATGDGWLK
jgi:hypothetical protein